MYLGKIFFACAMVISLAACDSSDKTPSDPNSSALTQTYLSANPWFLVEYTDYSPYGDDRGCEKLEFLANGYVRGSQIDDWDGSVDVSEDVQYQIIGGSNIRMFEQPNAEGDHFDATFSATDVQQTTFKLERPPMPDDDILYHINRNIQLKLFMVRDEALEFADSHGITGCNAKLPGA